MIHSSHRIMFRPTASLLAAVALATPAVAQFRPDAGVQAAKEAMTVYVRDSGVATEKLALAARMERAAQWDKSADVYQEIIEKYADRVVPTRSDAGANPTQYTSAAMVVQEKIAKWPEAGLTAYRRRFDDVARDRLAAAGDDPAALQRVMSLYFPTDAGKTAGLKLLAASTERGQFALAAWIGRRLLTLHPSLTEERPAALFETAIAEHLGGNDSAALGHLDELKTNFPAALGTVRGVEVKLADSLAAEIAGQPAVASAFRADSWPMAFGAPDADAVPAEVSKGGARLFSVELAPPPGRAGQSHAYKSYLANTAADRAIGGMTGIFPAIDNGELFFQDNARIYAISLASGMPLPGWAATYPGDKHGQFSTEAVPAPHGQQLAVSVTPDAVIAVLGQIDFTALAALDIAPQPPQIVSLDRQTGRRNWATSLDRIKLPESAATLREGMFYGTPIVVGDSIYVMVRATRGGQFDECHVVSLHAADGTFQWSAYVASTSLGNRFAQFDDGNPLAAGATGQLSYSDGRLYVLTNLGAVACLDASDGKTLWLDIYPRSTDQLTRMPRNFIGAAAAGGAKPFAINPPIVHGSQLFVMPQDSASIFVYDAASGDQIAAVPRTFIGPASREEAFEPVDMLLAVVGPKLVLGNRGDIFTVPWKNFDPARPLVANGGMYRDFISSGDNDKDGIRGRPFVAGNFVLVPTGDKLYRMSLDKFKHESLYPAQGRWDDQESAGNVIATPDNLIIAGPSRVTAYADLGVATAKLDKQLNAAPDDVEIYLRYASLLFAAGRCEEGITKLDTAIDKLGGRDQLQHGAVHSTARDHLFDIAVGFAVKLQKVDGASPKLPRQLFDRAQLAADSADQQVRVRFALAAMQHQNADWAGELALYQQVLASADWRHVPVNNADGAYTAAAQAEAAVMRIIKDSGEAIYAPYETAAAKRLDEVKHSGTLDPKLLLAIADEYPASKQTLEALAMAADAYEASHDPRQASRTLRRLLHSESLNGGNLGGGNQGGGNLGGLSNERKLITLQALARNYLAVPRQIDTAIVRLRQASAIAADTKVDRPLTMPDGVVAKGTVGQALALASSYREKLTQQQLPTFGVPATSSGQDASRPPLLAAQELLSAAALVDQQEDLARSDRVVALGSDGQIHAFDSRSARQLIGSVKCNQPPIGCAYSGETLIVVTPNEAIAIGSDDKLLWTVALNGLPGIEATASDTSADDNKDPGELNVPQQRMRRFPRINNMLPGNALGPRLIINPNGAVNGVINGAINGVGQPTDTGDAAVAEGGERISNFRLLSDRVLIGTTTGRLASIGLSDGKIDWQARPLDRPVRHFLSNDDFLAVSYGDADGTNTVCVLDALSGQPVSREAYDAQTQLTNLALSPDGVLVAMTPTQLIARDLYEPSTAPWRRTAGNNDMPFSRSAGPDQFVITADRVLAVYFSGGTLQSVRAYDLRTLQPAKLHDDLHNKDIEASYSPMQGGERGNNDMAQVPVSIQAAGPAFYLVGTRSLAAYNLDHKDSQWSDPADSGNRGLTRDFAICQDYVVQMNQIANANLNAATVSALQMGVFSRAIVGADVESGNLEQRPIIRDAAGFIAGQWQVADGAFYYLSGGHKLKVMHANP